MSYLQPGTKFGEFDVIRELGVGGMGAVYLVQDPETGIGYAAKIMLESPLGDSDFKKRFIREAEIAMEVEHPALVKVYEVGRDPDTGYGYMIMDYVSGGDLHEAIARRLIDKKGPYRVSEALAVIRPLLGALEAADQAGIVHRDIKPDNILFDSEGRPRLADLGVAKIADDKTLTRLTLTNIVVGTPAYMAPEQMTDSHSVDIRADLYSLGVVLWEMLSGECPTAGLSTSELMARAVKGERLPDIRRLRPKLPHYVLRFLNKLTDPNPERRFRTPFEALKYLDDWREQEKRRFRRFLLVSAVLTTLTITAILIVGIRLINAPEGLTHEPDEFEAEFSPPDNIR